MIRFASLFFAVAVFAPALAQGAPNPPAAIIALENAMLHAANTNDATAYANLYTPNAVVVDENPPYAWSGSGAGMAWWHVVDAVMSKMKLTSLHAVAFPPTEYHQSATDAYMIVPMRISGVAAGKPFNENGTTTYTFHRSGDVWKISSQVWTTARSGQ
jgi:ketosteroid isomerase-like protein